MDSKIVGLDVKQHIRLFALAVWDAEGKQYLPLFGYDGQVEAYAPAYKAINIFNQTCFDSVSVSQHN